MKDLSDVHRTSFILGKSAEVFAGAGRIAKKESLSQAYVWQLPLGKGALFTWTACTSPLGKRGYMLDDALNWNLGNPSSETQAFLLLPLGKGGTPGG